MGSSEYNFPEAPDSLRYEYSTSVHAVEIIEISQANQFEIIVTWDGINGDTEKIIVE